MKNESGRDEVLLKPWKAKRHPAFALGLGIILVLVSLVGRGLAMAEVDF